MVLFVMVNMKFWLECAVMRSFVIFIGRLTVCEFLTCGVAEELFV